MYDRTGSYKKWAWRDVEKRIYSGIFIGRAGLKLIAPIDYDELDKYEKVTL